MTHHTMGVLSIEPKHVEAWGNKAQALMARGRYEEAEKSLAHAFELRHRLPSQSQRELYRTYAQLLLRIGVAKLSGQDEEGAWTAMALLRRIQIQARIEGRARAMKAGLAEASAALAATDPEKLRVVLGMLQDPWVGWTAASYIISEHWPRGLSVVDAVRAARE